MLLLIPTPIGNLQDLSPRALQALEQCDILLSEDTRMTKKLLSQYQIEPRRLIAYHKHNEKKAIESILPLLEEGLQIGLVSDAGTPCIFDPGALLVAEALARNIPVSALPGPTSPITALSMSGLLFSRFQCIGFLPREKEAFEKELKLRIAPYHGVTIALESPERILRSVEWIALHFPEWEIVLVKEISKLHETIFKGPARTIFEKLSSANTKGEWVILFSEQEHIEGSLDEAIQQVAALMNQFDFSLKSAVQATALLFNLSKNDLYTQSLKKLGNLKS